MSELPLVLTVGETAKALRVSRGSMYEAIRSGDFPHAVRVGRTIRVPRHALLQFLGAPPIEDAHPNEKRDSRPQPGAAQRGQVPSRGTGGSAGVGQ